MKKNHAIWYAVFVLFLTCICNTAKSQTYIRGSLGNNNFGFSLETKAESIKNLYYGFGISIFGKQGNRGQDYTNFYSHESPDVYENVLSQSGSIFIIAGTKIKGGVTVMPKVGLGSKIRYFNGKTAGQEWYVRRGAGTYLLYGLEASKHFGSTLIGCGYDNFNGFLINLGFKIN